MVILMSKLEDRFLQNFRCANVKFEREKTFPKLKNGRLRFDVWVPSMRAAFEIQGEQHYKFIKKFYKTQSDFLAAKLRDRQKISFCLANNINLYIIPFWEVENIHSIAEAFNIKYLARTPFKNEADWNRYQNEKSK